MTKEKAGPVRLEAKQAGLVLSLLSRGREWFSFLVSCGCFFFKSSAGMGLGEKA